MGLLDLNQRSEAVDAVVQTLDFAAQLDDFWFDHEFLLTARMGLANFVAGTFGFLSAADVAAARLVRMVVAEVDAVGADAVGDDAEFIVPVRDMRGGESNGLRCIRGGHSPGAEMIGPGKEDLMGIEAA